jgi:hypothetical protein
MNHKDRMLAGLPYKAWLDGLSEERNGEQEKIYEYICCVPRKKKR